MFLIGKIRHNDHASETGFLAIEAAVNAAAVDYSLKSVFDRQRPYQGAGSGHFFAGGSSFPSEHAAVSWAVAGVIAHEYPGPFTKLLAYGLASAVTVARVTGKEHFPSDVLAGGALGYFVARQIYQRHRDPEVSPAAVGKSLRIFMQRNKTKCAARDIWDHPMSRWTAGSIPHWSDWRRSATCRLLIWECVPGPAWSALVCWKRLEK